MSIEIAEKSKAPTVQLMDNYPDLILENEYFHCSWEWHIARLSPVCALIYPHAFKLGGGIETKLSDRRFFASAEALSIYFDYSQSQVRRGLKELEKAGFFQLISRKKFKPNNYRVLSHDDWAMKNNGKCTTMVHYPWTGEGDPLGQTLWKMSGGQVKFKDFQVKGLRGLRLDENMIVEKFSAHWEQTGQKMNPKNVPRCFYKYMENVSSAA